MSFTPISDFFCPFSPPPRRERGRESPSNKCYLVPSHSNSSLKCKQKDIGELKCSIWVTFLLCEVFTIPLKPAGDSRTWNRAPNDAFYGKRSQQLVRQVPLCKVILLITIYMRLLCRCSIKLYYSSKSSVFTILVSLLTWSFVVTMCLICYK